MRCFIENDPTIGEIPRRMILKRKNVEFEDFFDVIITDAYKDLAAVLAALEVCDEIYVDTTYPAINGSSSSMLTIFLTIALREQWMHKRLINIRPEGMMDYDPVQISMMNDLKVRQHISFEHIGE